MLAPETIAAPLDDVAAAYQALLAHLEALRPAVEEYTAARDRLYSTKRKNELMWAQLRAAENRMIAAINNLPL